MCGCEPGFVCSRCANTPDDERLEFVDEPLDPLAKEEFLERVEAARKVSRS